MVYKKFIKRDGQLFGPYYYESYRDSSGKVKTKYLPDYSETDFPLSKNSSGPTKKFIFISIAITIALLFVIFASLFVLQTNYNFENSTTGVGKSAHNFASTFNSLIGRAVDDLGIDNSPTSTEEASTPESDASVETPASSEALLETTPVVEEVITLPQEEAPVEPITPGIDASVEIPTSEPSSDSSTSSENQTISEPLAEENQTSTILENNSIQETLNDTILPVNSGSNLTLENNSIQETIISNDSSATLQVSVKQYGAVLGKPVKWEKKVRVDAANGIGINNLEISLPYLAENISVINRNSVNGQENEVNNLEILDSEGNTLEGKQSSVDLISGGITGNVISARGNNNAIYRFFKSIEKFFKNIFSFSITGRAIDSNLQVSGDNITVQINEQIADNNLVTIEYETVAPYAEEIMIDGGKEVTIIGPDEVHYKDILAFSELSSEISSSSLIKFYWINETTGNGQEVSFEAKDYNDNGLIDTIEWVVPHLSSQRYIILGGGWGGGFTNVIEMKPFGPNFLVPEHFITSCSVEFAVYPLFVSDFCLVSFNNFQTNYTLNQYNATYFNTTVLFNFPNGNYDYKFWCQNESVVNNTKGNYFTLSSIASCSAFQGGDGTAGNPYQIASWAHLNNTRNNLTASYILVNDLSSLGQGYAGIGNNWRPIGVASQFEGVFDGGNHTISDLIMGLPFNSTTGLFGVLKGNISNLGLINVKSTGSTYVGSFVGDNRGTISRSYATGKINGSITLGGLVGINWGNISNSYSLVNVTGDLVVAGLVGENYGIITDSYSAGKITNSTNMNIGGLVGTEGRVINSFWDINASGQKTSFNGTGKTTLEMKNISTLGAWDISSSLTDLNDGYPYLAWQAANGAHVWSIYSNSSG